MSVSIGANGNSYSYPQTGDTLWGDDATNWASAVSAALSALGLGATVNSKAVVDMISTTKGALLPRMTTTQRDAIATPPTGLLIYNTTTNEFNVYTGSAWFGVPVRDTLTTNRIIQWDGSKFVDSSLTASGSDLTIAGNFTAQIITANTRLISPELRAASSAGILFEGNGGTDVALFGAGGGSGATFYGAISAGDGTVSLPGISFTSDLDNGLYRIGTNQVGISAGGTRVGEFGAGYGGFIGNVLQIQSTTKTDTFSTSSTSFTDVTGLSVTITPKYSNSKILLIAHLTSGKSADVAMQFRFERGGTAIGIGDASGASQPRSTTSQYAGASTVTIHQIPVIMQYYDSPSTTSATTYKVQTSVDGGIGYVGRSGLDSNSAICGRQISTITALEVMQ